MPKRFFIRAYILNIQIYIDETPLRDVLGENANKLSDEKSASLEGDISYTEIANALKNMKNDKSPGLDGFTVDLFQVFLG